MKVNELISSWDEDSKINELEMGQEAIRTDRLHFKYTKMIIEENVRLAMTKNEYNKKYKELWQIYTKDAIRSTDLKVIAKSPSGGVMEKNAEMFIQADEEFQVVSVKLALQTEICNALKDIKWQLTKRNDTIKNYIAWKKFMAGGD